MAVGRFLIYDFLKWLFYKNLLVQLVVKAYNLVLAVFWPACGGEDWLSFRLHEYGRLVDFLLKLIADDTFEVIADH